MKNIDETSKAVDVAYHQSVRSFRSRVASERGLAGLRSAADLWALSMTASPKDQVRAAFQLVQYGDMSPIMCFLP